MAKKTAAKAAPKKAAAPTRKAAPRKAAATNDESDKLKERLSLQNFKRSAEGIAAINEMKANQGAMIERNIFHRESNKNK